MPWSYLPHTPEDRKAMLAAIGVDGVEELFADIPADLRLNRPLNLPAALSEPELTAHLAALANNNANLTEYACFLGAGAYDHYIPSVVDHVLRRSEFYTAYTQYQPEISQGYLQALWEYQSLICEITGMAVANASLYDGGTGMAEAAMMAAGATRRTELLVAKTVHPHYRTILATYAVDRGYTVGEIGYQDGQIDMAELKEKLSKETAAVLLQTPNFFGCMEDCQAIADMAHAQGTLVITAVDPICLGLLEAPGKLGADIVVGEGQSLGLPVSFGGPYLGFLATTEKLMRKMPGRIVGQTTDQEGRRGFVLTLQAREQHIRRERATSNICSNEALCALAAAVYLNTVGKEGFRKVALLACQKAHYAYKQLTTAAGCKPVFTAPFFKEFVVRLNKPVAEANKRLLQDKIIGGFDIGTYYPELAGCMLIAVTEKRTRGEIDKFSAGLGALA
ncbi:aminomethyl-transferring glycine dehydrogenase subunit GcvPA [Sporomusa acidovorans]|uniref:Probable glycine dehydrogenase (decarboxylating) subunit 1 n=1 Tax=Sporomusa acidovorans (strain ATCC 49682 / DSM 3132 / Mol) TaxID=1123286 RepID=A0ABZ3JAT0_SPOA4|nr:aminomethyl-transferring glycine dehydrogenase subunit GcvPA [Sporomusa acidovorans]OZC21679.1 putative glycine dehydrogenase (decarboxylating) subunit 1 [Sporomusa acidovorans DSM 3132]SDD60281.1 glycine dehydrogenase (decarboxylating) alpha subunit [Sporomusa acidovorans]